MWKICFSIVKNYKNALKKHQSFPNRIVNPHTTYRAMCQNRSYFTKMNDDGHETISSVLNEEISEMLCEMYRKRWSRAENEWLDVISVLIRIFFVIRENKRKRYNEICSYLRYKRSLRKEQIRINCLTCPHNNSIDSLGTGIEVCSMGFGSSGECPINQTIVDKLESEAKNGVSVQ